MFFFSGSRNKHPGSISGTNQDRLKAEGLSRHWRRLVRKKMKTRSLAMALKPGNSKAPSGIRTLMSQRSTKLLQRCESAGLSCLWQVLSLSGEKALYNPEAHQSARCASIKEGALTQ